MKGNTNPRNRSTSFACPSQLLDKDRWKPDKEAATCGNPRCKKPKFSVTHRRHHCRCCGNVFCDVCAPKRWFPSIETRLCAKCCLPVFVNPLYTNVVNTFMSFLTDRSMTAVMQTSATIQSHIHIPNVPYKCLRERFPTLGDPAQIGKGGFGLVYHVEDRHQMAPPMDVVSTRGEPLNDTIGSQRTSNRSFSGTSTPPQNGSMPAVPNSPITPTNVAPTVAVKLMAKKQLLTATQMKKMMLEIEVGQRMNHPSIVKIYEVFQTDLDVVIVMELGGGGCLRSAFNYIQKLGLQTEVFAAHAIFQIASALDYMYTRHGIVHRDIKLENIVCSRDFSKVMLIDFGLAEVADVIPGQNSVKKWVPCGTGGYASPENVQSVVTKQAKFTADSSAMHKADIFSLGVVLFMMLSQQKPWSSRMSRFGQSFTAMKKSCKCQGENWDKVAPDAKQLCEYMLRLNPELRASGADVMRHDFIQRALPQFQEISRVRNIEIQKQDMEEEDEWVFLGVQSSWIMIEDVGRVRSMEEETRVATMTEDDL